MTGIPNPANINDKKASLNPSTEEKQDAIIDALGNISTLTTPSDTQPVSATELPLPTGASTEESQDRIIGLLKSAVSKLFRLTFDTGGSLRTSGAVTVSSGTVTTVSTVTQSNISYGDMGKNATSIIESRNIAYNIRRNYAK